MADELLDIGQLRAFEAVAQVGSFTRAAGLLGLAQSTVSQQVQRLEARLQGELFQRLARGTELTAFGEALLVYARSILKVADQARCHFSRPPRGRTFRVGIAEELATTMLGSLFAIFQRDYPTYGISFQVGCLNMFDELEAGMVDVVITKRQPGSGLGELLWQEPLTWVGHPEAIGADGHVPLATYGAPSEIRNAAVRALVSADRSWNGVMQTTSAVGLIAAVEVGLGVAVFGRNFVPAQLQGLMLEFNMPVLGQLEYVVARRTGRADTALDAFVRDLRDVAIQIRGQP